MYQIALLCNWIIKIWQGEKTKLLSDLKKIHRFIFSVFAIIAIFICIDLLIVYINANFNPGASPSFCVINDQIDCDAVAKSYFSRFIGVPLSIWGLGFYSLILF